MKEVKKSDYRNIIIDCSYDILASVLEQAQQVGILSEKYRVIITSLVRCFIISLIRISLKKIILQLQIHIKIRHTFGFQIKTEKLSIISIFQILI